MQKWFHKYPDDGVAVHALHHHFLPRQPELPPKAATSPHPIPLLLHLQAKLVAGYAPHGRGELPVAQFGRWP